MKSETMAIAQLAGVLGVNRTSILRRSKKEKWPYENGGNRAKKFLIAGLPEEIRMQIAAEQTKITPYIYRDAPNPFPVPVGDPGLLE